MNKNNKSNGIKVNDKVVDFNDLFSIEIRKVDCEGQEDMIKTEIIIRNRQTFQRQTIEVYGWNKDTCLAGNVYIQTSSKIEGKKEVEK